MPHALPLVLGHQIVGAVEAVGEAGTSLREGDRVGVAWLAWACGVCEFCRSGRENLCERARFTGYDVPGGYAEAAVADARFVYRLPASYPAHDAAPLLCAGIIGFRSLRLAGVQHGDRVGLFGFGASAHLAIQVARHWGADDFGGTLFEENVHAAADFVNKTTVDEIVTLIRDAGFTPAQRTTDYEIVRTY